MNLRAFNLLLAQTLWVTPVAAALTLMLMSQLPKTGLSVSAVGLASSAVGFVLSGIAVSLYWKGVDVNSAFTMGADKKVSDAGHIGIAIGTATVLLGIVPATLIRGEEYAVLGGIAVMIGSPIAVLCWVFGWRRLSHS